MAVTETVSGIRITHPDEVQIEDQAGLDDDVRSGQRRRRGPSVGSDPAGDPADPIDAALESDSGVTLVDDFVLVPSDETAVRRRSRDSSETLIEIDVAPGETAALLCERDGVLAWTFPQSRRESASDGRRSGTRDTITFSLDDPGTTPDPTRRGGATAQRRGLFDVAIGGLIDRVRVRVVRFLAGAAIDVAGRFIERNVKPGLIHITTQTPDDWVVTDDPIKLDLPRNRTPKVMLWVHGTFSSTLGSFADLANSSEPVLDRMTETYDAIISYDHATLSASPEQNAADILESLLGLDLPQGTEIDILAYSRGGLVTRVLCEQLIDGSDYPFSYRRAIFVACTNSGTALASPENWKTFLDLYTNLGVAAGKAVRLVSSGTGDKIISQVVRTLTGFMQAIVDRSVTENAVPGIAAMAPRSALIENLNAEPEQSGPDGPRYFAIGSNFDPKLRDVFSDQGSFLGRLLRAIADGQVDLLMDEANDLVVNTASMIEFGGKADRLKESVIRDANPYVFHTNYFGRESTGGRLIEWIDPAAMTGGPGGLPQSPIDRPPRPSRPPRGITIDPSPDYERPSPPTDFPGGQVSTLPTRRGDTSDQQRALEELQQAQQEQQYQQQQQQQPPYPYPDPYAPPSEVECYFAAEMEPTIPLHATTGVQVTVSREEIVTAAGVETGTGDAQVRLDLPITLELRPKRGCTVEGPSQTELRVPDISRPEIYDFSVRGTHVGLAELEVIARQGLRRLTTISLQPEIIPSQKLRTSTILNMGDTDRPTLDLDIYEYSEGTNDPFRLRFVLRSEELDINLNRESPEFKTSKTAYVNELYKRLEGDWGQGPSFGQFMFRLGSFGADLYNELVPEDIQRAIWDYKDEIGSIRVISQEPFIPWEVLYVVEPGKQLDPVNGRYLAELGLVRWFDNMVWPRTQLRLRPDRARHVVPDYVEPGYKLVGAEREEELLIDLFGSQAAPDESLALSDALNFDEPDKAMDLVHFACHGEAQAQSIWNASILLAGSQILGTQSYRQDFLDLSTVKQRVRLEAPDGNRPIVFLNACQAGKTGQTLAGTGGLSEAFVRKGAGLFIGSLWSIGDATALTFAKTFYAALIDGAHVAAAIREARTAAKEAEEPTWLAYTVYGHPYARLNHEDRAWLKPRLDNLRSS